MAGQGQNPRKNRFDSFADKIADHKADIRDASQGAGLLSGLAALLLHQAFVGVSLGASSVVFGATHGAGVKQDVHRLLQDIKQTRDDAKKALVRYRKLFPGDGGGAGETAVAASVDSAVANIESSLPELTLEANEPKWLRGFEWKLSRIYVPAFFIMSLAGLGIAIYGWRSLSTVFDSDDPTAAQQAARQSFQTFSIALIVLISFFWIAVMIDPRWFEGAFSTEPHMKAITKKVDVTKADLKALEKFLATPSQQYRLLNLALQESRADVLQANNNIYIALQKLKKRRTDLSEMIEPIITELQQGLTLCIGEGEVDPEDRVDTGLAKLLKDGLLTARLSSEDGEVKALQSGQKGRDDKLAEIQKLKSRWVELQAQQEAQRFRNMYTRSLGLPLGGGITEPMSGADQDAKGAAESKSSDAARQSAVMTERDHQGKQTGRGTTFWEAMSQGGGGEVFASEDHGKGL